MSTALSWTPRIVTLASGTVSVRTSPSGRLLDETPIRPRAVMIHGLGGSSLNWIELMSEMDDELDIIAVDLPGFGASPPPRDGDYSPRGHARQVAALLDHLNDQHGAGTGQRWQVFGNSLGGAVAVQLAAERPDLVATLTLIAPALPARRVRRGTVHMPVIAIPGVGERLVQRYLQLPAERRVDDTFRSVFGDPARLPDARRRLAEDEVRRRDGLPYLADATLSSLRGLLTTFFDASPRRPWRLAEQIEAPVLAVYGQRDQLVDAKAAHRVTRHFKDAHVVVLPDSGHVAMMEHPVEVAAAWRRFLANPKSEANPQSEASSMAEASAKAQ